MKSFHIFRYLHSIKYDVDIPEYYDYGRITIKIMSDTESKYISIIKRNVFLFSFIIHKDSKTYLFKILTPNGTKNIVIDSNDFDENESYLILKYGREVSSGYIINELGISTKYLHGFISDAIIQYNVSHKDEK